MELLKILEEKLDENKKVKLKIYALEYFIEIIDKKYIIYPELYTNRKAEYKTLKELFEEYTIYNENLLDNVDRITIM